MKATELRAKSVEELNKELLEIRREQFNLRLQQGADQNVRSHLIRLARRNLARIKTILHEKEKS